MRGLRRWILLAAAVAGLVPAAAHAGTAKPHGVRQYFGTNVQLGIGGGSLLTFEAPGGTLGTLAVGGFAKGFIRGRFLLNADYLVRLGYDPTALALGDVPGGRAGSVIDGPSIDQCDSVGFRTGLGSQSGLTFRTDGTITGKLVLTLFDADLGFGCEERGSQVVTVAVTGKLGRKRLTRVVLDGRAAGVKLPGGITGSVGLHLVTYIVLTDPTVNPVR